MAKAPKPKAKAPKKSLGQKLAAPVKKQANAAKKATIARMVMEHSGKAPKVKQVKKVVRLTLTSKGVERPKSPKGKPSKRAKNRTYSN